MANEYKKFVREEEPPVLVGDFRLNRAFMLCFVEAFLPGDKVRVRYGLHKVEEQPVRVVRTWKMASGGETLEKLNLRDRCNWALEKNRRLAVQ